MQVTHPLNRARQMAGSRTATILGTRTRTWAEHSDRVARLADALRTLGVEPGDRVGLLALNSDRFIEVLYGVWWCGAIAVPLNYRFSVPELSDVLNDCDAKVLIVDDAFQFMVEPLRTRSSKVEHIVHAGDASQLESAHLYEDLLSQATPMLEVTRRG